MRPTLLHTALDAIGKHHVAGHRCNDGEWYNDATGTRTPCPIRRHLDTAREQADRLHAQVHDAAHDDTAVRAVLQGMTGFTDDDLTTMGEEEAAGWMHSTRLAIETLAEHLDRDPVREARTAAVRERLTAAGLTPGGETYGVADLPALARAVGHPHAPEPDRDPADLHTEPLGL